MAGHHFTIDIMFSESMAFLLMYDCRVHLECEKMPCIMLSSRESKKKHFSSEGVSIIRNEEGILKCLISSNDDYEREK